MSHEGVVYRADEFYTDEVLSAQDGKTVPLTDRPGGKVIGEATLKYDPGLRELRADFNVDPKQMDPDALKFMQQDPSFIFKEP